MNPAASFGSQPLLKYLQFTSDFFLQHNFSWNKRCSCAKLLDEFQQNLCRIPAFGMCHIEMFPADQTAVPDEEYLYNRILLISGHGDNILIFSDRIRHLLLLRNMPDTLEKI